jgi:hypothetical protein
MYDVKIYRVVRIGLRNLGVVRNAYTILVGNDRKEQIRGRTLGCEDYNQMGLQKPEEQIKTELE